MNRAAEDGPPADANIDRQSQDSSRRALFDTADFALLRRGYLLSAAYMPDETTIELTPIWDELDGGPLQEMGAQAPRICERVAGGQVDPTLGAALSMVVNKAATLCQWHTSDAEELTFAAVGQQLRAHGLSGDQVPPPGAIDVDMTMAEACRSIWYDQLLAMLLCEAGVRRRDDIEYVHHMRVATRRARVAAAVFGPYFHRQTVRRLNKGLRKTGKLLGKVRDLDVAIDRLEQKAIRRRKLSATDARLLEEWRAARMDAHSQLLAWLDSEPYTQFFAEALTFCRTAEAGAKPFLHEPASAPVPHHVADVVPAMLIQRFAAVRSYQWLWATGAPVDYATIHLLRIDCKYLRYNLEFFAHLLGRNATTLIKRLKHLQDVLGELNDAVVGEAMLLDQQEDAATAVSAGLARKLDRQRALIVRLEAQVPDALAAFTGNNTRKRLAGAIARL